jgi:hypothetical protein
MVYQEKFSADKYTYLNLMQNKFVANVRGTEYHDNKKGVLCKPSGTQWFLYIYILRILPTHWYLYEGTR